MPFEFRRRDDDGNLFLIGEADKAKEYATRDGDVMRIRLSLRTAVGGIRSEGRMPSTAESRLNV
jgi:hypothetical protein